MAPEVGGGTPSEVRAVLRCAIDGSPRGAGPSGSPVSSPLPPSRQHGFTIVAQVPGYWPSLDTPHGLDAIASDLRGLPARTYAIRRAALVTFALATACSPSRQCSTLLNGARAPRTSSDFPKTPLHRDKAARPLPGGLPPFDPRCQPRMCSAPAVPPGFGVLLRAYPRRSVAPCTRSWGSARFRSSLAAAP